QLGFDHDSERPFAAHEQVDPIHARRERIASRVLGGVRQWKRGHGEVDFFTSMNVENTASHQRHSQAKNMPARTAITKAARSAGVGGDGPADTGRGLGRIGWVELSSAGRSGLHGFERYARANDR